MISIKHILTISQYESRVLWRNWFFRIVSLMGIGFLVIFNLAVFSELDTPRWFVLSNSWMMPYSNMVLISIPQAAAVIFLATGLIKKDKKLDTNEVFFVRPISNLDYVFGKALALFKMFFLLNGVLLCIPLIVNLTSPFATFNPFAFLIYPLLTSLPSIVFTTGIAFLLVTLLKNQPITIVLLLGVAGVQLIYYFDQFSNILDFMAFRLSMLASEIGGFVDIKVAIWQRSFYFITGIALLFITAFFLDRLASHKVVRLTTGLIGILLLALSAYIMFNLWSMRTAPFSLRERMIVTNGEWTDVPNVEILSEDISFELMDDKIQCSARMSVTNNTATELSKIYFTLNPGLLVESVSVNGKQLEFNRDLHIISIDNEISIPSGEDATILIQYNGNIQESVAHLEVSQERYESARDYFMFSLQKKYAFLKSDYVLLTKDVLWYPDTQVGYSRKSPTRERTSFVDFQLDVKTKQGLIPISQGALEIVDGNYHYRPEYSLPQISLVIGNYVKKEIVVDSITYAIYHYPGNDYFTNQLDQLTDTLHYLITDIVNEYKDAQKLVYPFKRLQFVETPVQYTAYNKIYESQQAFLQPETVFIPEEGGEIREWDFRRQLREMDRQTREENLVMSDKEKQAAVFNDLIKKVFTRQAGSNWFFDGRNEDEADYSLFANLYNYNAGVVGKEWPLLNRSIASYLRNDKQTLNDYSRNLNGISFTEECNNLMRKSAMNQILTNETDFSKIQKSITLKGEYLLSYLGVLVGEKELKTFLQTWVNTHQHQLISYEVFKEAFYNRFKMDIDPVIRQVFFDTVQPAFEITDLQKYEILDNDRKRYQVLLTVRNVGENDGVIEVRFNTGDKSDEDVFFRPRVNEEVKDEEPGYLSWIRMDETKQIGFVLDEKPNQITVNTLISRNIPSVITTPITSFNQRNGNALFEGERILRELPETRQYEVIVDNEDSLFSTFSPIKSTYLRSFLDSRNSSDKKYYGNWFRSYSKWLATTGSNFYGRVIRSAHFTRSGGGEKVATWSPQFEEDGFYDIYIYLKGKNQDQYQGSENRQYKYHYIIHHADGTDNILYDLTNAETGWNYLGSYYFESTGGVVQLTDQCELPTVYADAIKWVKQ